MFVNFFQLPKPIKCVLKRQKLRIPRPGLKILKTHQNYVLTTVSLVSYNYDHKTGTCLDGISSLVSIESNIKLYYTDV